MYLSNSDVHSIGWEPLEFLDLPPMAEKEASTSARNPVDYTGGRLSDQVRVEIAQRVYERLSDLVARHEGDLEDVRLIVRALGVRSAFGGDK